MTETYDYYFTKYNGEHGFHKIDDDPHNLIRIKVNRIDFFIVRNTVTIRHRVDGPAIIWGNNLTEWVFDGTLVTRQIKQWAMTHNIDLNNLSDEEKNMIKLVWQEFVS